MNRTRIKQTFAEYTNKYNASDPKIRLKIDHTYRVAVLAERIARTVTDIPIDRDIAWTMGMLHDIGRFEQVKRYGTFVDSESIDHAELGITILFEGGGFLHNSEILHRRNRNFSKSALKIITNTEFQKVCLRRKLHIAIYCVMQIRSIFSG